MTTSRKMDIDEFATEIAKMSDDDTFALMAALENASEAAGNRTDTDIVARIALVETEIETVFQASCWLRSSSGSSLV